MAARRGVPVLDLGRSVAAVAALMAMALERALSQWEKVPRALASWRSQTIDKVPRPVAWLD